MKKTLVFLSLLVFLGGCGGVPEATPEPVDTPVYPEALLLDAHLDIVREKAYLREHPPLPVEPPVPVPLFDVTRPYGVMIDNHVGARPQSGLSMADVVYEALAEGPITRYLLIIPQDEEGVLGPVRSARPYFIDFALDYGSLYAHAGGSEDAFSALSRLKVASLDGLSSGEAAFYRISERRAPHNLYTTTAGLEKEALRKGYSLTQEEPVSDLTVYDRFKPLEGDLKVQAFEVIYKPASASDPVGYGVSYHYDESRRVYERRVNLSEQRDAATGELITAGNILIIEMTHQVLDDAGRRALGHIGGGEGYYLTGGEKVPIEWTKESRQTPMTFSLDSQPVVFNPGRIFVQVVSSLEQYKPLKEDNNE